jgi:hypothetical protein
MYPYKEHVPQKQHKTQPLAIEFETGHIVIMYWVIDPIVWIDNKLVEIEREVTPEAVQADITKTMWPPEFGKIVGWHFVQKEDLPDRTYRNAWVKRDGKIVHDIPKARELHRAKIRRKREKFLQALDVEYQKADEEDNKVEKKRVAARKKQFRDLTDDPAIDIAKTVEELKSVFPDILKE